MLLALLLFGPGPVTAQNKTDRFSARTENTFLAGMNVAVNGSYDELSWFYRTEYLRRFGRLFEGGLSLGFFNYQDTYMTITYQSGNEPKVYKTYLQTSIVSLDFMGYIDVVHSRRSILRLGVGYSLRFVKSLIPHETYLVKNSLGVFLYTTDYKNEKGTDGGVVAHLGYGFRITPEFTAGISARYYSEGKYVSLSMAGLDFSYSF